MGKASFLKQSIQLSILVFCLHGFMYTDLSARSKTTQKKRVYIGVIDQIDPPWIVMMSESGSLFYIDFATLYPPFKEGQWVIYFPLSPTKDQTLYPLTSSGIAAFKNAISHSIKEQINHLKQGEVQTDLSLF